MCRWSAGVFGCQCWVNMWRVPAVLYDLINPRFVHWKCFQRLMVYTWMIDEEHLCSSHAAHIHTSVIWDVCTYAALIFAGSFIWLLLALLYNAIRCRSEEHLLLVLLKAISRKQMNMNTLEINNVGWEEAGAPIWEERALKSIIRHWHHYITMWSRVVISQNHFVLFFNHQWHQKRLVKMRSPFTQLIQKENASRQSVYTQRLTLGWHKPTVICVCVLLAICLVSYKGQKKERTDSGEEQRGSWVSLRSKQSMTEQ